MRRTLRRPNKTYSQGDHQVAEYTTTSNVIVRVIYQYLPGAAAPFVISAVRLGKFKEATQSRPVGAHHDRSLDLAYVALLSGKITETLEVASGIYCDLDNAGEVMGMEIFNYSRYEDSAGDNALGTLKRLPLI